MIRKIMGLSIYDYIIYFSPIFEYFAGFLTVKINHLLIIRRGKLWSSGNAQQRYFLIGVLGSVVFAILMPFFVNDPKLMLVMTLVFAGTFAIGIKHAMRRFSQYEEILEGLIQSLFPKDESTGPDHDKLLKDTLEISTEMLDSMQKSYAESLKILFFVFDAVFTVFFFSLIFRRKFRLSRFKNLEPHEQVEYMDIWESTTFLNLIPIALKALIGYSYYSSPLSWDEITYNGEVLRRSYIN